MIPRNRPIAVLDSSAVLAYLKREPGYEHVRAALEAGAVISTANLAEVYARVAAGGQDIDAVATRLFALGLRSEPLTETDARASARFYPQTRPHGLSLGDRTCLALGLRLRLPVLTTDRAWATLSVGVEVRLLR